MWDRILVDCYHYLVDSIMVWTNGVLTMFGTLFLDNLMVDIVVDNVFLCFDAFLQI